MKRTLLVILAAALAAGCSDSGYEASISPQPDTAEWKVDLSGSERGPFSGDTTLTVPESGYISVTVLERSAGMTIQVWKVRDGGINGFFYGEEEFLGQDTAVDSGSVAYVRW